MCENCTTNQRPQNCGNSAEHDQQFSCLWSPILSSCTKFYLNPVNGLSANAQKLLDQSDVRKWQELSRAWPEVNQAWEVPWWTHPPSLRSIWSAVWMQMHGSCWAKPRQQWEFSVWPKLWAQSPEQFAWKCGNLKHDGMNERTDKAIYYNMVVYEINTPSTAYNTFCSIVEDITTTNYNHQNQFIINSVQWLYKYIYIFFRTDLMHLYM